MTKNNKIALDCRMIGSGGIGTYFESLLPFFIKEYECLLIGKKDDIQKYEGQNNVTCIYCDIKTFCIKELLFFPKTIINLINSCNCFYTPYCNVPSNLVKKIKVPIFTTIHDVLFLDVKGLTSFLGIMIRKYFYQRAINKSKVIFTVSQFSKERIIKNLRTKKKQIVVTYNSVPSWFINANQIKEKIDSDLQKKDDYILFVGNIKAHKGLSVLLDAYKILLDQNFSTKLYIVGNANNFRTEDKTVFSKIQEFKENSIVFTGKITNEQLKEYYSKAKLLVQPSFYEGFGMPPLEALHCKTNVVLSDIPVFLEIYKDFPVTFFRCGNAQDLAQKIKETYKKEFNGNVMQKYSFSKTFDIIRKIID